MKPLIVSFEQVTKRYCCEYYVLGLLKYATNVNFVLIEIVTVQCVIEF